MKIAVFLPNWIGDAVMATPALRAIRRRFPLAEIVGVCRAYVADVLAGLDVVNRHLVRQRRTSGGLLHGLSFLRQLRRERFDVAVLFPNSFRSALAARVCASRRVGFDRDGRGWLLTDRLTPRSRSQPHPVIDEYLRLAGRLGCVDLTRELELAIVEEDERLWNCFQQKHSSKMDAAGLVCLNPGGAFGSAKHWPAEHFAELARRIAAEHAKSVLVLCGPSERDVARAIVARANHPHVLSLADEPPRLGLTKAAVKHCELLVTTDSGVRHFAPPFDVPVVTLFGPTHMAWSETFYDKATHLQIDVDCGPCQRRTCPLGHHRCMRDLSVEQVYRTAVEVLQKYEQTVPAATRVA